MSDVKYCTMRPEIQQGALFDNYYNLMYFLFFFLFKLLT